MDNGNYKILCLGTYCLPRVITTCCGLKPRKADGEKTCPFDLAFCWDFDSILDFLDNEFKTFFDNIKFDYPQNEKLKSDLFDIFGTEINSRCWILENASFLFNHEQGLDREKFIEVYKQRIQNLYDYLLDKDKKLYIVIASFNKISPLQIEKLNRIVTRYRSYDSFINIIINQSNGELNIHSSNTFVINCNEDELKKLFKAGWADMLKKHSPHPLSVKIYNKIVKELEKIVIHE